MEPLIKIEVFVVPELHDKLEGVRKDYRRRTIDFLNASGLIVRNAARKSILKGPKSGKKYRFGGVEHIASAPGEAPANRSGRLLSTIEPTVDEQGLSVSITASTVYAKFLEFGTRKMAARPFMNPALTNNLERIKALFRAIMSGGGNAGRRGSPEGDS